MAPADDPCHCLLRNVWCTWVTGCKLGEVLLHLALGVQRLVVAEFNKEAFEDYNTSEVSLVFFTGTHDGGLLLLEQILCWMAL